MSLLKPMTASAAYLKAGFLGFQGSGKTRTAVELAIGTRAHFGRKEPIAFFDTESGTDYVRGMIEQRTERPLLGLKSRSFSDLMQVATDSVGEASVLIVDSISHVWRELIDSYLRAVNARLEQLALAQRRPFVERREIEMSDWGVIKATWASWTDWFLNSPIHVIVAGRAGYEYADREDEEGNTESVKTGIKMRAEGEFGYEPALLVEMQRIQRFEGDRTFVHRATVIKDKFDGALDGKQIEDPGFQFFSPHVSRLNPAAHQPVDTAVKTDHGIMGGDSGWHREKQARTILAEEIEGELQRAHPGQTVAEKTARRELLERVFGTCSQTAISDATHSDRLKRGLAELRGILRPPPSLTDSADPRDQIPDWPSDSSAVQPADRLPGASSPTSVDGGSAALPISSGDAADPSPAATPARGAAAGEAPSPAPTPAAALPGETATEPAAAPAKPARGSRAARKTNSASTAPTAAAAPPQPTLAVDLAPAAPADPDRREVDAEVHELELTIDSLDDNPEWADVVETRIRALPDGMDKARVWGAFFDWRKNHQLERASIEAAARATGSQP